jgi:plastocyanin
VTESKGITMRTLVFTLVATLLVGVSPLPWRTPSALAAEGSEGGDSDDMKREIRQLRAQVQTLRAAMAEAAELDKQRLAIWNRALKSLPSAGAGEPSRSAETSRPAAEPPSLPAAKNEPPEPSHAPSLRAAPPRMAASGPPSLGPARRHAAAPDEGAGVVRGRVEVPAGEPVAYVYVENLLEPAVKGRKVVIEQKGKAFNPTWAVVQRGTVIEFPNNDNIYHNVFSNSSGNSFDLGLYNSSSEAKTHTFIEAGAVDIYCNIHPQMSSSALVVPNRFFSKVKPDGKFEITGVPAGKRKVVAWAPGSRLTAQWIDLDPGATSDLSLKLESKSASHKNKAGRAYGSYE